MGNEGKYYIGLDIGTNSVGYAVTDEKYNLLKFHGEPAWGVTVFDQASLEAERRSPRIARRRLDRRQQRVTLIQELFAGEIAKKDPRFYTRISENRLFREDVDDKYTLFNDKDYTDKDYYASYPTIHHLICGLMKDRSPHDVRLVYLACSWLVAHRGHFLSNISTDNLEAVKDFNAIYNDLMSFFKENGFELPWEEDKGAELGQVLKEKIEISAKTKRIIEVIFGGNKPSKETTNSFPFSRVSIVKLLAGESVKLSDIYGNEDYKDFGSVSLGMDDEKLNAVSANIGEDFELIAALRRVYDWAVLVDVLGEYDTISEAKVAAYDQHKVDLALLKRTLKKYLPEKYDEMFRDLGKDNYAAYAYHTNKQMGAKFEKKNCEDFSKFTLNMLKQITPCEEDEPAFRDMINRLELRTFMPKQKNTDNRVIPHQLYWYELRKILDNASEYLSFLNSAEDGISVKEKIESVFLFRIPYFVGPLNAKSNHGWIERKAGKIYPWNFEEMVDLDKSEQNFIQTMTNFCTYLPGEKVLPKESLVYHKYTVLNEINNLRINGSKISVELKQAIYNDLFMNVKKVTRKKLSDYLISNGIIEKGEEDLITGIDININSNLSSQIAFKKLIESKTLNEEEVEKIIERASYAEDKSRLSKWLEKNFPKISDTDRKYICSLKLKDFGRLSRRFLCEFEGASRKTEEVFTILDALWNTQDNLMELLSNRYTFVDEINEFRADYYSEHPINLEDKLNEMHVSNTVRRSIYRTMAILRDVQKAFGKPSKIFIEMARGASEEQKGKRTISRKQQILNLYKQCKDEDVKLLMQQLDAMGEYADNKLQGDKLFLYYMQLGKCMYSGRPIELEKLATKEYDIDHIYPQAFVKDDSIINNKVLVLSSENGAKSDRYPINEDIRHKMGDYWYFLKENKLISEEKYKRLVRGTPFTAEEKMGFINRQLTETSQSTKVVAEILNEKYPETDIIYCKARLTSEFRQVFDLLKSRSFNDLHHAVDAYLTIVTGNVYHMKFKEKWFNVDSQYSLKTKTLFTRPLICDGITVWDGEAMLQKVKKTAVKNNAHFTKYAFFKKGQLFDQKAKPAAKGLVPLKKGLPTEKYGGYKRPGAMFYIPVKYKLKKKTEVVIMSVELLVGKRFLEDPEFAKEYSFIRLEHIIGKKVDEISFPMGMRPWKVNTMLELDGFRVCITGISSGGKKLIAETATQFIEATEWNVYIKWLEKFVKKIDNNEKYLYDEKYDHISVQKNMELYDIYIKKHLSSIYRKRIASPVKILLNGRETFASLSVKEQARVLLNIHMTFGRITGGCDLRLIGGGEKAAATSSLSSSLSNWKKNYTEVRIINPSASGLWEQKSENILDLL